MILVQDVNDPLLEPICTDSFSYSIGVNIICKSLGFSGGRGYMKIVPDQIATKKLMSCNVVNIMIVFDT